MNDTWKRSVGVVIGFVLLAAACEPDTDPPSGSPASRTNHDVLSPDDPPMDELVPDLVVDLARDRLRPMPDRIRSVLGLSAAHYAVSPDGTRIAFEGASDGYVSGRLYIANVDGSDLHRATTEPVIAHTPSWSPDGERIVYVGAPDLVEVPGPRSIVVLDVRSGETTRLFRAASDISFPSFAPDGRTIVFTRRAGDSLGLWGVPVSGGRARIIRREAAFGVYSPDGRLLAFRDPGVLQFWFNGPMWSPVPGISLAEVAADATIGSREVQLDGPTGSEPKSGWPMAGAGWEWSRPVWSPDGTRIAYMDGRERWGHIRVIDIETGITTTVGPGTLPAWLDRDSLIVHRWVA